MIFMKKITVSLLSGFIAIANSAYAQESTSAQSPVPSVDFLVEQISAASAVIIQQTGVNNSVSVEQSTLASQSGLYANNRARLLQSGDGNIATLVQNGTNNSSVQEQFGNDNTSNVIQRGRGNRLIHRQFGDTLSVPAEAGGLVIEQTGGASIIIEQYGPATAPFIINGSP